MKTLFDYGVANPIDELQRVASSLCNLNRDAQRLVRDRNVRILFGPHKGRTGRCTMANVNDGTGWIFVEIYKINGESGFLDWSARKDGRRYYTAAELELIP